MSSSKPVSRPASDLYADEHLAQFYDVQAAARADFAYCEKLAREAASVLDLGCGTGVLAARIALAGGTSKRIVGADPAKAMLDIACARQGGENVRWVEAGAETLDLDERFDLIMLTGHAFQVFLTSDQQRAVLATIARHLTPTGCFIFDTRNPAFPARKERTKEETLHQFEHAGQGTVEKWNVSTYDEGSGILTFSNGYRILKTGKTHEAQEQIRYTPKEEVAALIVNAGLAVESWLGDWEGAPFHAEAKEIIPIGKLA